MHVAIPAHDPPPHVYIPMHVGIPYTASPPHVYIPHQCMSVFHTLPHHPTSTYHTNACRYSRPCLTTPRLHTNACRYSRPCPSSPRLVEQTCVVISANIRDLHITRRTLVEHTSLVRKRVALYRYVVFSGRWTTTDCWNNRSRFMWMFKVMCSSSSLIGSFKVTDSLNVTKYQGHWWEVKVIYGMWRSCVVYKCYKWKFKVMCGRWKHGMTYIIYKWFCKDHMKIIWRRSMLNIECQGHEWKVIVFYNLRSKNIMKLIFWYISMIKYILL